MVHTTDIQPARTLDTCQWNSTFKRGGGGEDVVPDLTGAVVAVVPDCVPQRDGETTVSALRPPHPPHSVLAPSWSSHPLRADPDLILQPVLLVLLLVLVLVTVLLLVAGTVGEIVRAAVRVLGSPQQI